MKEENREYEEGGREEENGEKESDVDGRSRKNGKYLRDRKRRGKEGKVVMGGRRGGERS